MTVLRPSFLVPGKILAEGHKSLRLRPDHLARHMFVAGGSGGGKTKLLELLCRQLVNCGIGFTYVDPHGDGADAVMRYLAVKRTDPSRVHYLRPGLDRCFSFDPFARPPAPVGTTKYESWLISTIDRITEAFLRNVALADQEMMKRLKRWLGNVLYAAGVDVNGRHLGLSDASALTRPQSEEFTLVLDRVRHVLHKEVRADFDELAELKSGTTRNTLLESTMNLLREELFSPAAQLIFSQGAPSIDLRSAILGGHYQLVNLRKTADFSRKHRRVVGGMLINFLIHEAENIGDERPAFEDRVPHVLIIDEAENFIGEDIRMGFAELRKFRLSLCLAFQDLGCLKKGDLDLVGKVVSQCGLQMTFQQGNPDDIEYLGKSFAYGNLDFTPLFVDTVLPDGYEWADTESVSEGEQKTHTDSRSESAGHSESRSRSRSTSESIQRQVSLALSESHSEGESSSRSSTDGYSWSRGTTGGTGTSGSFQVTASDGVGEGVQWSTTDGAGRSTQTGRTDGATDNRSEGETIQKRAAALLGTDDKSENTSKGRGVSRTDSVSEGENVTHSDTAGGSRTVTRTDGISRGTTKSTTEGASESAGRSEANATARGTSSSVAKGTTRGTGESRGRSEGQSEGETVGDTTGRTAGTSDGVGTT